MAEEESPKERPKVSEFIRAVQIQDMNAVVANISGGGDPNEVDSAGCSALHWAVINKALQVASYLLNNGANVDIIGGDRMSSPLHWAVLSEEMAMVALLIEHGADVTIRDNEDVTLLHLAAMKSEPLLCGYLVATGVDPNARDSKGRTPAMWVMEYLTDPIDMMRFFTTSAVGANINIQDDEGNTLIHRATHRNAMVFQHLHTLGVDHTLRNKSGESAQDLQNTHHKNIISNNPVKGSPAHNDKEFRGRLHLFLPAVAGILYHITLTHFEGLQSFLVGVFSLVALYGVHNFYFKRCDTAKLVQPAFLSILVSLWVLYVSHGVMEGMWLAWTVYGHVALVCMLYTYFKCYWTDPGVIHTSGISKMAEMAKAEKFKASNFCCSTLVIKPLRSKYDRFSKALIARFDHFCPFMGVPIGYYNFKWFIAFLLTGNIGTLSLTASFACHLYIKYIWADPTKGAHGPLVEVLMEDVMITLGLMLSGLLWFYDSVLCYQHLSVTIKNNITTNEYINSFRLPHFAGYPYIDQKTKYRCTSPFDLGSFKKNWCDMMLMSLGSTYPPAIDWRDYKQCRETPRVPPPDAVETNENKMCMSISGV